MKDSQRISTSSLLKEHGKLIFIGFLLMFFSVFGQSIFIGVYIPDLMAHFDLSQSEIGFMYMLGTLLSAVVLLYTGKLVDRFYEPYVLFITLIFLALGCLSLAFTPYAISIIVIFFLLRQCGQGLMPLIANSCVNRYIIDGRGRATAFVKIGAYLHTAIFPTIAAVLKEQFSWHFSWIIYAGVILVALLPLFFVLFLDHRSRRQKHSDVLNTLKQATQKEDINLAPDKTQKEVLMDIRFYVIMAILLIAPTFMTAIFFFQEAIASAIGISHTAFITTFVFSTALAVTGNMMSGYIMDHIGELFMLIIVPIVFVAGLILLILADNYVLAVIAMSVLGFANGGSGTLGGPIVAKLFGTRYFGAVKSMLFAAMVVGTAVSPFAGGVLLDAGYSVDFMLGTFSLLTLMCWVFLMGYRHLFNDKA